MNDIHLPHDHGQEPIDIPSPDDFEIVSTILKQLCDAVRIRIFWLLCHREECVLDISAMRSSRAAAARRCSTVHLTPARRTSSTR